MKNLLISLSTVDNPLRDIKSYELALLRFNYYADIPRSVEELNDIVENTMSKSLQESVREDLVGHKLYDADDADLRDRYLVYCILRGYTKSSNDKIQKLINELRKKYRKASFNIEDITDWDEEEIQLDLLSKDERSSIGDLLFVLKSDKATSDMKINALHHKNANKIAYAYAEKYGSRRVKEEANKLLETLKGNGAFVNVKGTKIWISPARVKQMQDSYTKRKEVDMLYDNYLVITSNQHSVMADRCKANISMSPELTKLIGTKIYVGIWR